MKTKIKVSFTVEIDEKEERRLLEQAKEEGFDYDDAGPRMTLRRLLAANGIDGCFPNEHNLGLNFTIHHNEDHANQNH